MSMDCIVAGRMDQSLARFAGPIPTPEPLEVRASSFEGIYRDHFRDVTRHVILVTQGRDDVDDIVAETFARAFAAWRSGHGPAGRPLPWLFVIARRILTDRWRRRRLIAWLPLPSRMTGGGDWDRRLSDVAEPSSTDPGPGRAEFWLWLDALSESLPARQRDVLLLRYERDLTDEDIGEILGLSASGVRTLASRAIAALRRHPELWS
jgi:RNA polymerase sigma-70 factor (ECF subfamily)